MLCTGNFITLVGIAIATLMAADCEMMLTVHTGARLWKESMHCLVNIGSYGQWHAYLNATGACCMFGMPPE